LNRFFGKATKLSRFGPSSGERLARSLKATELCDKAGLSAHLIDSEWKWYYLMRYEVEKLLFHSKVLTILTFTARHRNVLKILHQTLAAAESLNKSIGINIVAGNKVYLTSSEINRNPSKALIEAAKFIKKNYPDTLVFIGAEGLIKTVTQLAAEHNLIPMLILDREFKSNLDYIRDFDKSIKVALYAPYLISKNYPRLLHDILVRLAGYILRRRWVQKELKALGYEPSLNMLKEVVQEKKPLSPKLLSSKLGAFLVNAVADLTIYGEPKEVKEKIENLMRFDLEYFFGFPIKENEYQILTFGECINELTVKLL
jgi:hypothetical protein